MTIRDEEAAQPEPPIVFATAVIDNDYSGGDGADGGGGIHVAPPPIAPQFIPPEQELTQQSSAVAPQSNDANAAVRTISVQAPSQLPGGYEFWVDTANGTTVKVKVPDGGVIMGQTFDATVIAVAPGIHNNNDPIPNPSNTVAEHNGNPHNIPTGRWRSKLCGCCDLGCCHPLCCLTFVCHPCTLGQLLTRMNLSWSGHPATPTTLHHDGRTAMKKSVSAYKIYFCLVLAFFVIQSIVSSISGGKFLKVAFNGGDNVDADTNHEDTLNDDFVDLWNLDNTTERIRGTLQFAMWLLVLLMTWKLRQHVRERYSIPEESCSGCEDFCCAFWCICCTLCQIGRHTADYRTYGAGCCTENGLSARAPEVV